MKTLKTAFAVLALCLVGASAAYANTYDGGIILGGGGGGTFFFTTTSFSFSNAPDPNNGTNDWCNVNTSNVIVGSVPGINPGPCWFANSTGQFIFNLLFTVTVGPNPPANFFSQNFTCSGGTFFSNCTVVVNAALNTLTFLFTQGSGTGLASCIPGHCATEFFININPPGQPNDPFAAPWPLGTVFDVTANVPEPATMALMGLGLGVGGLITRRRLRKGGGNPS